MTQSCSSCLSGNKIFTFYNDETSYESAIEKCRDKNPRQNIATTLNDTDYQNLLTGCNNQQRSYWIGLKIEYTNCPNANPRFRWNNGDRCFDGRPLNVKLQPTNGNCFAVTIETRTPDKGNIIQARLCPCQQASRYICESMINNSPSQRTKTATLSSRITTGTSIQTTPDLTTKITNSIYRASTTNKYNQREIAEDLKQTYEPSTHVSDNPTNVSFSSVFDDYMGLLFGAVVVLIILLVVFAVLYRRYYKANSCCLPFRISSQFTKYNSPRKSNSISRFSTNEPNSQQHNIGDIKESGYQLAEVFIEQNEQKKTTEKNLNFHDQIQTVEEKNPYESFDDTDFSDDEAQGSGDQHFEASRETKERTCNDTNTPAVYASVIKSKNIKEECAYAVVSKTK